MKALHADGLEVYLGMLFGAEPAGGFLEIRFKKAGRGMGQRFLPWPEERALATELIRRLGRETDCYVGVAPRRRAHGGRDAIESVHALWADCDGPAAVEALRRFAPEPSMIVWSGSGGNLHAYWALRGGLAPQWAERANRRLAYALGGDMASTDAARILRPPGTLNFKSAEPQPVAFERVAPGVFEARDVVGDRPDPPTPRREPTSTPRVDRDDPLLAIPPPIYIEALTGREVGRDGKVRCPFHSGGEERTPSLHATYADGRWYCHGACQRGGTIIDFGALLFGLEPRKSGYVEIRRRLEADLLPALRAAA